MAQVYIRHKKPPSVSHMHTHHFETCASSLFKSMYGKRMEGLRDAFHQFPSVFSTLYKVCSSDFTPKSAAVT